MLGAIRLGPALKSMLHGVGPADGVALIVAPVVLVMAGMAAAIAAAARVLRADPAVTYAANEPRKWGLSSLSPN